MTSPFTEDERKAVCHALRAQLGGIQCIASAAEEPYREALLAANPMVEETLKSVLSKLGEPYDDTER